MNTRASHRPVVHFAVAMLVIVSLFAATFGPVAAHREPVGAVHTYIVRVAADRLTHVAGELRALGGHVTRELSALGQAVVRMDAATAARVAALNDVRAVSPDASVRLASDDFGGFSPTSSMYDPTADPNSMFSIDNVIRASDMWYWTTGRGVDVALLDSGVSPVAGLDGNSKIVYGPDLSFDSQNDALRNLDGFGHGTHMAGIIAGRDAGAWVSSTSAANGAFLGVAPNARIVSVKLADAFGATDVSQVIAGIDWVVQHAHDNGLNIRVINLSFGTGSMQDASLDPLAYAAEIAWRRGIVVVVSAGNSGTDAGRLSDPAIDPWVIAVGADDANGTRSTSDDVIPDYSSRGDGTRNPDLVAPGAHVQSLRVPGSEIDDEFGAGSGSINTRFLRGSGTSQAAAVTSGAVALLLQSRPWLDPNEVKALLVDSARPMPVPDEVSSGAGLLNIKAAWQRDVPDDLQSPTRGTGGGSLDDARGSQHLTLGDIDLTGEVDIFGTPFDAAAHADAEASMTSWDGGTWNGGTWSGSDWDTRDAWQSAVWDDPTWAGTSWTSGDANDGTWDGRRWADATWQGRRWADSQWAASSLDGGDWAVGSWS